MKISSRLAARAAAVVVAAIWLAAVPAAGQTAVAEDGWTMPRTPWGVPDLQGIWTNATLTPMERSETLEDTSVLTAEAAAEIEEQSAESRLERDRSNSGVFAAYNLFWLDAGTRILDSLRTSLVVDPPDGRIPYTEAGRARLESDLTRYGVGPFDSWVDADTGERCLTDGLPLVPLQSYNMNFHFLQAPGWIAILNEMFHEWRVIPLDDRPDFSPAIGQWLGGGTGRWEGDTLVIESVRFNERGHYLWRNTWRASRSGLHLIERITRTGKKTMDYEFTMTDPEMFTRPWSALVPMTTDQASRGVTAGPMFEFACHEGNRGLLNILRGARAQERE